ncbi:MAG: ComEC/Rec2 family competence protein [Bryobacteraceae bacterium]
MREPLLLPFAAVVAGIILGRALEFSLVEAGWPVAAFLLLGAVSQWRRSRALRNVCLLLACMAMGALREAQNRPGEKPGIDAGPREIVTLSGCVVEPSAFSQGREQFTLELEPGARARVTLGLDDTDAAVGSVSPESLRLRYGQRVEVDARIRRPHNFGNPGSFDYEGYLARQQIYWTASVARGTRPKVVEGRCGSRWLSEIFSLREAALGRMESLYAGDEYAIGMMEALLIGETSRMEKIWTENFRRTGTVHALVISGAHVAVLAGVLLFFLRLCAMGELQAIAWTAAAAWLYAGVSGFTPPVARAAGAFTLYLATRFFFRRARVLNLAAAFGIAYLLWKPEELLDASFQLSFFSVLAIAALAAPLIESTFGPLAAATRDIGDLARDPHLLPRAAQLRVELRLTAETLHYWTPFSTRAAARVLAFTLRTAFFALELILVSAVVQIGLALPMAWYFHRISFTGLSANLIVVPLLEIAIPSGFAAIFTGWHWMGNVSLVLLHLADRVADFHAKLEPFWRVTNPPLWLAGGFAISLVILAITVRHKIARWPAAMATVGLFAILLWQPWPAQITPRQLELTTIDVGQGDSLFVVFPEGRTMLIDGGGMLTYGRMRHPGIDIGEDVVSPYLWSRGIRHIDIVAATHAHADHTGGLTAILRNFRPQELWVGPNALPDLIEEAQSLGIAVKDVRAGPPFSFSGAAVEVLSPPPDFVSKTPGNNDSLALRIRFGERSFLLAGDMERKMELELLERPLYADVLKVGHHGSKTSTTQPFLDAVSPTIGIISAGFENSFGHPHVDVLARLGERKTAILRTDRDGLVTVCTDGKKLWWDSHLQQHPSVADIFLRTFPWTSASIE